MNAKIEQIISKATGTTITLSVTKQEWALNNDFCPTDVVRVLKNE